MSYYVCQAIVPICSLNRHQLIRVWRDYKFLYYSRTPRTLYSQIFYTCLWCTCICTAIRSLILVLQTQIFVDSTNTCVPQTSIKNLAVQCTWSSTILQKFVVSPQLYKLMSIEGTNRNKSLTHIVGHHCIDIYLYLYIYGNVPKIVNPSLHLSTSLVHNSSACAKFRW